VKHWSHIS